MKSKNGNSIPNVISIDVFYNTFNIFEKNFEAWKTDLRKDLTNICEVQSDQKGRIGYLENDNKSIFKNYQIILKKLDTLPEYRDAINDLIQAHNDHHPDKVVNKIKLYRPD